MILSSNVTLQGNDRASVRKLLSRKLQKITLEDRRGESQHQPVSAIVWGFDFH